MFNVEENLGLMQLNPWIKKKIKTELQNMQGPQIEHW